MTCPKCKVPNCTSIVDSRESPAGRRRRHLCKCGFRFSTIEILADSLDEKVARAKRDLGEEIGRVLWRHCGAIGDPRR